MGGLEKYVLRLIVKAVYQAFQEDEIDETIPEVDT